MDVDLAVVGLERRRAGRHLLLLFDFDGTLVRFSPDPDAVVLPEDVRRRLASLACRAHTTVGIISGRRLPQLQARLSLQGPVYLAGFHGLEIQGPGESFIHPGACTATAAVQAIAAAVQPGLVDLPGVFIEDKVFSIALHYRQAAVAARDLAVSRFIGAARNQIDAGRLRLLPGDCVVELLPNAAWHKGDALRWIRQRIERVHGPSFTFYAGDDVTDEDAFRAVGSEGITVAASDRAHGAEFRVDGPDAIGRLLYSLDGSEEPAVKR